MLRNLLSAGTAGAANGSAFGALEHSDLAAINRWLSVTRFRAAGSVALGVPLVDFAGGLDLPVLKVVLICAAVSSLSLVYTYLQARGADLRLLAYVQLTFDTLGIAAGLALIGSDHLMFRGLFLMTIIPATMVSGVCGASITVLGLACHGGLLLAGGPTDAIPEASPLAIFLVSVLLFAMIANQSFFYKRHLRDKNYELAVTGRRLTEANAELAVTAGKALALLEVSRALDSSLDLEVVNERLHAAALEGLGTDWCATFVFDPAVPHRYRLAASRGMAAGWPEPIGGAWRELLARVAAEGSVEITDLAQGAGTQDLRELGVASAILAAMRRGSHAVGIFATGYSSRAGGFTDLQRELVAGIAARAAVAIENVTLHAKQREEAETSAALLEVAELLNADPDAEDRFQKLTALTCRLAGSDFANILLYDAKREVFRFIAATDLLFPHLAEEVLHLSFGASDFPLLARVARNGWVEHCEDDDSGAVPAPWLRHWSLRSVLALPLHVGGEMIGALAVGSHQNPGPFSPKTRRLLAGIACQTLTAIENRRLIHSLRAASRLKSEFMGTMSHELRTPLNVVIGYTELLREGEFGPMAAAQSEICERVLDASAQLLELIQATLDVNRLDSGVLPMTFGSVDLRTLLQEFAEQIPARWMKRGVSLSFDVAPEVPEMQTDRAKLKMVVRNLVQNALKFTDQGSVTVRARLVEDGEAVAIEVADTGVGIDSDSRAIIFDMFRQVDSSDRRRHEGVGLGLYIVRQLTARLGGTVEVESEVGRGSLFRLCLPLQPVRAGASASGATVGLVLD